MDRERIQEIIRIAKESPLTELRVREGDLEVRVVKASAPIAAPAAESAASDPENGLPEDDGLLRVTATKVGFFHRGKGPASPPLAEEGDEVAEGAAIATLEALRKLTDVTADVEGVIERFLVEDGSAVEYGQPLVEIRLSKGAGAGGYG